jgi:hypothetical protein
MGTHDQNFKNLVLEYRRDALTFFAPTEAQDLPADAEITPLRQEQMSRWLGGPVRITDVPLEVRLPSGEREMFVVLLEEETNPIRFDPLRLVEYCFRLAREAGTLRVVPVVVFLRDGWHPTSIRLGTERDTYLTFKYIACPLAAMKASDFTESQNLVARLNLVNMAQAPEDGPRNYVKAIEGLVALEADPDRRSKFLDYIEGYARLTDAQKIESLQLLEESQAGEQMGGIFWDERERGRKEGQKAGHSQAYAEARALMATSLLRALASRGFDLTDADQNRITACDDVATLALWLERVATVATLEDLFSSDQLH